MASQKMRVAVTGGHGKIGKTLVPYLSEKGYSVFVIDQDGPQSPDELMMKADLMNFGQAFDALSSKGEDTYAHPELGAFDAVVHLASIPHPRMLPDAELFQLNMMTTFNVFAAAKRAGIKNIVWAASEVGAGVPFTLTEVPYLPADEDYPMRGYNVYALTKVLGEEMARQFCLNDPEMRITCLRLSNVMNPSEYERFETWQDDATVRSWNLWSYIDVRDAAQSIECALRYDVRGKEEFFITNDETVMRTPTADLVAGHYREAELRKQLEGNEVLLSNAKAKRLLGFRPQHHWTDKK